MGPANKLLIEIDGRAMLEHVLRALDEAALQDVTVVTGHEAEQVQARLENYAVAFVHNPDYLEGISSSLRCGLGSLAADVCAALVCLGDMPLVKPGQIRQLIRAFDPAAGREICVPVYQGKRGNPILWSSRFFNQMKQGLGDVGARALLGEYEEVVCEVAVDSSGVLIDVDTQQAMMELEQHDD